MRALSSGRRSPFSALVGISSLVAALLYLIGFSYRWSYYYNFGVQHIVFRLSVPSFLVTAFEVIRVPRNLGLFLLFVAGPVILFNMLIWGLRRLTLAIRAGKDARRWVRRLDSPLLADVIRALLILYPAYVFSSHLGYVAFLRDSTDGPANPLPAVTAVFERAEPVFPLKWSAEDRTLLQVIGGHKRLREIREYNLTYSTPPLNWRLLYRDDSFVYLFASDSGQKKLARRPLTVVIPNRPDLYLVLN